VSAVADSIAGLFSTPRFHTAVASPRASITTASEPTVADCVAITTGAFHDADADARVLASITVR
jgi:hypothetical protein